MQQSASAVAGDGKSDPSPEPANGLPAAGGPMATGWTLLATFTVTTFLSAVLLFSVQPMFAKMVLPILGGAPSVWAVAMVFFQAALLAGYCYAHLLIRSTSPRAGGLLHLAVFAAAMATLPIGVPQAFGEPPTDDPALWQLGLFAVGVGLPFFAVAANAPLLQAWFATSGHPHGRDPYFLYGASNLGSLLVLLAYPLVLEPAFGLRALAWLWAAGFVLLAGCIAISWLAMLRGSARTAYGTALRGDDAGSGEPLPGVTEPAPAAPTFARRLGWVGLAFVPSALLTAFTNHITMDVASAPLLWVIPLALYLLTFVLVFRDRPIAFVPSLILVMLGAAACWSFFAGRVAGGDIGGWSIATAAIAGALGFAILTRRGLGLTSMEGLRAVHLGALVLALLAMAQTEHEGWFVTSSTGVAVFFAATMVAHRTLYETRPAASRLTEFYLLMSLGGVLGGFFAALIAPRIFSQIYEYPLLLVLTVACRPGVLKKLRLSEETREELLSNWLVIASSILAIIWVPKLVDMLPAADAGDLPDAGWWLQGLVELYSGLRSLVIEWGSTTFLTFLFAVALLVFWRKPSRQLFLAMAMCATVLLLPSGVKRSDAQRSYFGVYRIYPSGQYNILTHGTTLHGAQKMRDAFGHPAPDTTPGTYYHPEGPMAQAVKVTRAHATAKGGTGRYGVVGLGAGSLACLATRAERWRFYEIDPLMVRMASDPSNFTYLETCQPKPPDIVLGDARLTLAKEPEGAFDVLVIDAFTSDAVPIHLMTAEALKLYLDKTSQNGAVVLHISNRYLDLDGVLASTAKLVPGAQGIIVADDEADGGYGQTSSTVAIFAKSKEALAPYREMKGMRELPETNLKGWTDDYSDIIGPFLSRMGG